MGSPLLCVTMLSLKLEIPVKARSKCPRSNDARRRHQLRPLFLKRIAFFKSLAGNSSRYFQLVLEAERHLPEPEKARMDFAFLKVRIQSTVLSS